MAPGLSFADLLDYTGWERAQWLQWFRQNGPPALETGPGFHGDGRFQKVGELIRHIFSAEKRYMDRLSGRPITDTSKIPPDGVEPLFEFGARSRADLRQFIASLPADRWDVPETLQLMNSTLSVTPRKIVAHVLFHEIRHWAQIATILRWNGFKVDFHDFLFSPAMGATARGETSA